jgi:tetratricopeptide (TPR) repeat protein
MNGLEEPGAEHLTDEELADLAGGVGLSGLPAARVRHLQSCDSCTRIVSMDEEDIALLRRLAMRPRTAPGPNCPAATEWAELAAGLVGEGRRNELLAHAGGCDACGAVFGEVMSDFSMDLTEAEISLLASLESSRPEWQRKMAGRMADISRDRPVRSGAWLAKAAVALLAVGGGSLYWIQSMPKDPAGLIATAYAQQRPFEYRIPGAKHAPVRQERRAVATFQRPASLFDAEATIARELEKHPDDVKWLELRARAEMLGRDPEAAISTLRRALERKPDDPGLMAGLGVAYALRAETSDRDINYGYAFDYLSRSLKSKHDDPVALFNRAVVNERMLLYEDAIRDWRRYLELDPSGPWREEAQQRVSGLEQKKNSVRHP